MEALGPDLFGLRRWWAGIFKMCVRLSYLLVGSTHTHTHTHTHTDGNNSYKTNIEEFLGTE